VIPEDIRIDLPKDFGRDQGIAYENLLEKGEFDWALFRKLNMKNFAMCENNPINIEIPKSKNALLGSIRREVGTADSAWLAAAIEGEGNLSISQTYQRGINHGYKDARIGITNGHINFIKKVSEIYYDLNICFYYQLRKGKKHNHQARLDILTSGYRSCLKILNCIYPYLTSKRKEADLLVEYILWRLDNSDKCANIKFGVSAAFDKEKAENYAKRLSWLKHNHPDPSQTTRKASEPLKVEDGDIVGSP